MASNRKDDPVARRPGQPGVRQPLGPGLAVEPALLAEPDVSDDAPLGPAAVADVPADIEPEEPGVLDDALLEPAAVADVPPDIKPEDLPTIEVIQSKPQEFIFSPKRSHGQIGLQMLSNGGQSLVSDLRAYSGLDIEVIATRRPAGIAPLGVANTSGALLVRIDPDKGRLFAKQSTLPESPIWVDENKRISCFSESDWLFNYFSAPDFLYSSDGGASEKLDLCILGADNKPLPNVGIKLYSSVLLQPLTALTNADGMASFQLPSAVLASIVGIVTEPLSMHWSKIIRNPQLVLGRTNKIRVQAFFEFDQSLKSSGALNWGVEKLGALSFKGSRGQGVKIGVIDSGCDASHPMLQHVTRGVDFNRGAIANSWKIDEIGHGTHVAGIIGARYADQELNVRGVAPESDLYIYKVFPQGDFFILGGAIEAAIADGVDIVNMSLGSRDYSNDIAECIHKAKEAGILCFVAAGNSGDPVQFPANLTTSIAVSAIGYKSSIPDDSVSANTFQAKFVTDDGFFSPTFTCFGESIDFTGPGVGIISTVPNGGLRVLDGTSMATPHLAGMAALYLGSDPVAASMPRGAPRADYVYNCLKMGARQFPFPSERSGFGMPNFGSGLPLRNPVALQRMVMASTGRGATSFWVGGGGSFSGGGASGGW